MMIVPILTLICCESPNSLEQDKNEIEETRRQITENALKENGDAVAEFLTDSIVFSNPNEKDIEGKENVRNYINIQRNHKFRIRALPHTRLACRPGFICNNTTVAKSSEAGPWQDK